MFQVVSFSLELPLVVPLYLVEVLDNQCNDQCFELSLQDNINHASNPPFSTRRHPQKAKVTEHQKPLVILWPWLQPRFEQFYWTTCCFLHYQVLKNMIAWFLGLLYHTFAVEGADERSSPSPRQRCVTLPATGGGGGNVGGGGEISRKGC